MMKLYIGNLALQATEEELELLFRQAGTVEAVCIVTDRDTHRPRGFGFVDMATRAAGQAAIDQLNGHKMYGQSLVISEAQPREQRDCYATMRIISRYA